MEPKFTDKDVAYQLLYIAYGSVQDITVIRALRIRDRIAFIVRYSHRKQYNMYVADVDTADLILIRDGTLDECCKYFLAFARYMLRRGENYAIGTWEVTRKVETYSKNVANRTLNEVISH